jgi:hypothetical protein
MSRVSGDYPIPAMDDKHCHPERTREGSGFHVRSQILRRVLLRMTVPEQALQGIWPPHRLMRDVSEYLDMTRVAVSQKC